MDWARASVAEVDGQLDRLRDDLRAPVAMEGDALAARERALAAVDSANAIIQSCRENEATDKAEIDCLLDERRRIVRQREASE